MKGQTKVSESYGEFCDSFREGVGGAGVEMKEK